MRSIVRTHAKARVPLIAALAFVVTIAASGCSTEADPDDITWTLAAKGDIVAMDSTTGVYVSGYFHGGYMGGGGGRIESEGVIDYQYARALDTGGYRQDLVSSTYDRLTGVDSQNYPGSNVVTIHQDAKKGGSDARIEIYRCTVESDHGWSVPTCVMPDGQSMKDRNLRVDIHVPEGTVIEKFSDQDQANESETTEEN